MRAELREKQEEMDQLISTVEDLHRELKKIPQTDGTSMQEEMELLRDQWLQVDSGCVLILQTLKRKKSHSV